MTPTEITEYRRIANSEEALSREFVAARAILKLCDEIERLQSGPDLATLKTFVDSELTSTQIAIDKQICIDLATNTRSTFEINPSRMLAYIAKIERLQAIEAAARAYVEWAQGERGRDVEGRALYRELVRALRVK